MTNSFETTTLPTAPLLLRVEDAAKLLSVSKSLLWQLIWADLVPHIRIGRAVRVPRQALEEWVTRNLEVTV